MSYALAHLVPGFGLASYGVGEALASLPRGVWLQSGIRPMKVDNVGLVGLPTLQLVLRVRDNERSTPGAPVFRAARPEDFRYRVVMVDGDLRVQRAEIYREPGMPDSLDVRRGLFSAPGSELLPKIQHAAFVNGATVDPKQDWQILSSAWSRPSDSSGRSGLLFGVALAASVIGGGIYLYRRRSSRG